MKTQETVYKKGDRRYLLTLKNGKYHFTKMIKKRLKNGPTKTTNIIVSDFYFLTLSELSESFMINNGIKENEFNVIAQMLGSLSEVSNEYHTSNK